MKTTNESGACRVFWHLASESGELWTIGVKERVTGHSHLIVHTSGHVTWVEPCGRRRAHARDGDAPARAAQRRLQIAWRQGAARRRRAEIRARARRRRRARPPAPKLPPARTRAVVPPLVVHNAARRQRPRPLAAPRDNLGPRDNLDAAARTRWRAVHDEQMAAARRRRLGARRLHRNSITEGWIRGLLGVAAVGGAAGGGGDLARVVWKIPP